MTCAEFRDEVLALAKGLLASGIRFGDRVAIMSRTRYEWTLFDFALWSVGAQVVPVYPTSSAEQCSWMLHDAEVSAAIVEHEDQAMTIATVIDRLPRMRRLWQLDSGAVQELYDAGAHLEDDVVHRHRRAVTPESVATIIYTSGTTGRPKGVRLPHSAWTYEAASVDSIRILTQDDLQYLWLPLAHVFGKVLLVLPLQVGFPTAVDGRVDKIVDNLAVVKPTFMGAAPRIFEKAYGRITTMMAEEGGIKAKLFEWAVGVGGRVSDLRAQGKQPDLLLRVQHALADALVLKKVRERFGGRIRFFISGSAALNEDVARWFDAVGMLILEGYGLTETSAASFVNRPVPGGYQFGSVGWPLPGTEVKIAEDGEILLRGPGITPGYHGLEDLTREVIDEDGWFHTGDIGEVDEYGFLRITDRKKDLFKTSGGKYVAPQAIESMFKGICPYASQMVVEGAGRNFVTAIVTLDPDAIQGWAEQHGLGGRPYAEIVTSPQAREMVQGYIDQLNEKLNRWEQIKKFIILDHDLSIEEGELTPSLKLKRKLVTTKYKDQLDQLYSG